MKFVAHNSYRRWKSRAIVAVMALMLAIALVPLVSLLWTLCANGAGAITPRFLTSTAAPVGEGGGIAHAIAGSLSLLALASCIAVPLGLANGIYLARRTPTHVAWFTRLLLDVMSGIPAIIAGVFIYTIVVRKSGPSLGVGFSMLAGALALAMIMLPIFARTSEEAIRAIPRTIEEAGLALGLPRRRVILRVILRAAIPAILSGLFLSLARVSGEAAPLLFTAFGSNEFPGSPLKPVSSLPQLLFDYARQPFEELVQQAWGAALVLVALILAIRTATFVYLRWRYAKGAAHT